MFIIRIFIAINLLTIGYANASITSDQLSKVVSQAFMIPEDQVRVDMDNMLGKGSSGAAIMRAQAGDDRLVIKYGGVLANRDLCGSSRFLNELRTRFQTDFAGNNYYVVLPGVDDTFEVRFYPILYLGRAFDDGTIIVTSALDISEVPKSPPWQDPGTIIRLMAEAPGKTIAQILDEGGGGSIYVLTRLKRTPMLLCFLRQTVILTWIITLQMFYTM
ncbi:MAG: hypothetical protein LBJ92_01680 [Holosporales bacterium]|jgi:hypothetical protein|nr:hypothetical protein [Holosporales bacterium]